MPRVPVSRRRPECIDGRPSARRLLRRLVRAAGAVVLGARLDLRSNVRQAALSWIEPLRPGNDRARRRVRRGSRRRARRAARSAGRRHRSHAGAAAHRAGPPPHGRDRQRISPGSQRGVDATSSTSPSTSSFCRSSLHHFARSASSNTSRMFTRLPHRPGQGRTHVDLIADPEALEQFDPIHRLMDPSHVRVPRVPNDAASTPHITFPSSLPNNRPPTNQNPTLPKPSQNPLRSRRRRR